MTRSKFLISVAALAASIVACSKDSRDLPKSPVAPSWPTTQGFVFGHVYEPVAVPVDGVVVTIIDGPFKGRSAPSDAAGVYEIRNVEGEFTLSFQKPGYATTTRRVNTADSIQVNADVTPLTPQADVSGSWSVTFEPSSLCKQSIGSEAIAALNPVEYGASIVQRGARLEITLTDGGLAAPANLEGTIQGTAVSMTIPPPCDYYCTPTTPPPPVLSELPDGRHLMIGGIVSATLGPNSIAGSLNGIFVLTSGAPPYDWAGTCAQTEHHATFTR